MAQQAQGHALEIPQTLLRRKNYYSLTFLGAPDGTVVSDVYSVFCDFTGTEPRFEVRRAAEVWPKRMINLWESVGQSFIVVNEPNHLALFYMLGGNALVETGLAETWMPDLVGPKEVAATGAIGFTSVRMLPPHALRRAPTPKVRMRILTRDGFRCRICGRRPDDNIDIVLNVHHIRPWGRDGLTIDENLITLCHTCHGGLDPHESPALFDLIGVGMASLSAEREADEYWRGVRVYRELVTKAFSVLNDKSDGSSVSADASPPNNRASRQR